MRGLERVDSALKINDLPATPLLLQVFRDQPSMALMRFVLAAEQAPVFDQLARYGLFDLSSRKQFQELTPAGGPAATHCSIARLRFASHRTFLTARKISRYRSGIGLRVAPVFEFSISPIDGCPIIEKSRSCNPTEQVFRVGC